MNLIFRHVSLTVPFILTWSPYLALAYLELALPRDTVAESSHGWVAAFDLMSVGIGIVVCIVCILEPSFLRALSALVSSENRDNSYREQTEESHELDLQSLMTTSMIKSVVKIINVFYLR